MATDEIVVQIEYRAHSGQAAAAHDALAALIRTVVAGERDCLSIDLHQSADDDTMFLLHERWTSREAYVGPHMQTPHIRAFIAEAPRYFAGRPAISFWRPTVELAG